MTSADFANPKYRPMAFPMPFGANDPSNNYIMPGTSSVSNAPSFQDGFPSAFSSPKSLNGQYVTRKQMNGIGNLATRFEFFKRAGGIVTFDSAFASSIGGYPYGAVLDYLDGTNLNKVVSLIDNNTVNFTDVGVDGVNWAYLNRDEGAFGSTVFFNAQVSDNVILGVFKAPKTGVINCEADIFKNYSGATSVVEIGGPKPSGGNYDAFAGLVVADLGNGSSPSIWPSISINYTNMTMDWGSYRSIWGNISSLLYKQATTSNDWVYGFRGPALAPMYLEKDRWYGIRVMSAGRDVRIISATTGGDSKLTLEIEPFTISGSVRIYYPQ